MSELTIHYPESPLNRGADRGLNGPGPGERILAGAPFGAGDTPRFALMAAESDKAQDMLRRYSAIVEPALREPLADGMIRLVRPDGYVAAVDGNWGTIANLLASIGTGTSAAA